MLFSSFFLCPEVYADTLKMKDGRQMQGRVAEQHEDRVILNTAHGEVPVMRDKIQSILYDAPEKAFLQIGESHEAARRWNQALAYYEKALQANPDSDESKKAILRVQNISWSEIAVGPDDEVDKKQALYDTWGKTKAKPTEKKLKAPTIETDAASLRENFGLVLAQKGDWVFVAEVFPTKDLALLDSKKGDRLVEIDGRSLRYLTAEVVQQKFFLPRNSDFTLEFERDCVLSKTGFEKDVSEFGLKLKFENRGLVVESVTPDSPADRAGLREDDMLASVNGVSIRNLPLNKLLAAILAGSADSSALSLRRRLILSRK